MLIDSHCHLNMMPYEKYQMDVDEIVQAARDVGVRSILCVGTNYNTSESAILIAKQYPEVYASVGIHPSDELPKEPTVEELVKLASHEKVVAIGETGLDYYYNEENLEVMRERFRIHIQAAQEVQKPVIIHTRDAREDTIHIMRSESIEKVGGVMHCFTESLAMAEQALDMGFYISFSGIVTFKNAKELQEVVKHIPLQRMLIETDAPYLTPVPYRGKPNKPEYVKYVAEKVAELKAVSYREVIEVTGENYQRLFNITVN